VLDARNGGDTRPASEFGARPEGWAVLEDRPPLQFQQVPLRYQEGLLPPGFEVSSAVECFASASDAGQVLIVGHGLGRGTGGRTAMTEERCSDRKSLQCTTTTGGGCPSRHTDDNACAKRNVKWCAAARKTLDESSVGMSSPKP
jgi:hypothetical protein